MIAVARKDHRLAVKRRLGRLDLMQHMLVTIEGSDSGAPKHQPRVPTQRILSVGSIESAIDSVRSGLCFGWLPKYRIESELKTGEFVPLNLSLGGTREVRLNLVCKDPSSISPEVTALAELLGINREPEEI
jgi:DNA-binding transcriptional LysR family regulator